MRPRTKWRLLEMLGWVVAITAVWFSTGCGSAYKVKMDNPSWGLHWRVDTGLWWEAKSSKAEFAGVWPGGPEEPWEPEPTEEPE
jgi:hypothetical protein